jgi:hypothetical protein
MQRLPLPAALTVSGVKGEKIDVTGYVKIPLQMEDGKTGEVRSQIFHKASLGAVRHGAKRPHPRL